MENNENNRKELNFQKSRYLIYYVKDKVMFSLSATKVNIYFPGRCIFVIVVHIYNVEVNVLEKYAVLSKFFYCKEEFSW